MRVGVVGCGGMGRHHLGVLNRLPNFEIAAVCDISPKAAQNAAGIFPSKTIRGRGRHVRFGIAGPCLRRDADERAS